MKAACSAGRGDLDRIAEGSSRKAGQQLINDPLERLQGVLDRLNRSLAQAEIRTVGACRLRVRFRVAGRRPGLRAPRPSHRCFAAIL